MRGSFLANSKIILSLIYEHTEINSYKIVYVTSVVAFISKEKKHKEKTNKIKTIKKGNI